MGSVKFASTDIAGASSSWRSTGSSIGSSLKGAKPKELKHVAILVYGKVYEFGPNGITITRKQDYSGELQLYPVGDTRKTEAEINKWIEAMQSGDFKKGSYKIATHNCIVFAIAMMHFLGLKEIPQEFVQLKDWCKQNETVVNSFQKLAP